MESLSVSEAMYDKLEIQYKELIWREAKRCYNGLPPTAKTMYGQDGLFNEGCIVLAKIAGRFNPDRGVRFITLLTNSLKNRFGSINTRAFRLKRGGKSQALSLAHLRYDEEPRIEIDETGLLIADMSAKDANVEIIVRGFLNGENEKDICDRTGMSPVVFAEKFTDLEIRGRELLQTAYNYNKEDEMSPKYKPGERVNVGDREIQVPDCYGDYDEMDSECSQCVVKVGCAVDTVFPEVKPEKKSRRKSKPPVEETSEPGSIRRSRRKLKLQVKDETFVPVITEKPSRRKKKGPSVSDEKSGVEIPKPSRCKGKPGVPKVEETKAPEKKTETKVKPKVEETKAPEKKSRKKTETKVKPKVEETKAPEKKSRKKTETKVKPKVEDGPTRRWRPPTGGFFYTLTEGERVIAEDLVGYIEVKPFVKVEHYHNRVNVKGPSHHGFLKLFDLQIINGRLEANMRTPSQEILELAVEKGFEVTARAHESFGFPLLTKKLGLAFRQLFKLRLEEMVPVHKR